MGKFKADAFIHLFGPGLNSFTCLLSANSTFVHIKFNKAIRPWYISYISPLYAAVLTMWALATIALSGLYRPSVGVSWS